MEVGASQGHGVKGCRGGGRSKSLCDTIETSICKTPVADGGNFYFGGFHRQGRQRQRASALAPSTKK